MKFYFLASQILLLLFFTSCSKKQTSVKLEVSHNFVFGGPATASLAGGGLMVWGQSSSGASFGKALEGSDSLNLQLTPGTWSFYVMAWDGTKDFMGTTTTNYKLGGHVSCGKSAPTSISGDAAKVTLTLNNGNCSDPVFKGSAITSNVDGKITLAPTRFSFCDNVTNITSPGHICADTREDLNKKAQKAPVYSFRVIMKNFMGITGSKSLQPGGVVGECITYETTAESGAEPPQRYGAALIMPTGLPAGGPGLPFHMDVEIFTGSIDCNGSGTDTRGSIVKSFPNGVTAPAPETKYFLDPPSDKHRSYVTVTPASICSGRGRTDLGGHPFAGGNGSQDFPYIICTVPQWYTLNSGGLLLTSYFKLQANLDFNPYSKGFTTFPHPPAYSCAELGTNFLPIGATAYCSGSDLEFSSIDAFKGSIEGANFTLHGLRLRSDDNDFIGVFAKLENDGSTPASISNLHIKNMETEGNNYVGALAGDISPTIAHGVQIFNVSVQGLDLRAREYLGSSYAGGLAGSIINSKAHNVSVKKAYIRADGAFVGGAFGDVGSSNLKNIFVEGEIEARSTNVHNRIGGVAGRLTSSSILDFAKFEGQIITGGSYIGGISGEVLGGSSATNVYSIAFIRNYSGATSQKLGGLFGEWDSSGAAGPGYSLSYVKSDCATGCGQGSVAGSTITTGTVNPFYKLSAIETGENAPGNFTGETVLTLSQFANPASVIASNFANAGADNWSYNSGDYPRFDLEKHPCQLTTLPGDGSSAQNPKMICNEGSYLNIMSIPGQYFKLAANIRLPFFSSSQTEFPVFSKHLDGNGFALIGGKRVTASAEAAHIHSLSGSIRNLNLFGLSNNNTVSGSDSSPSATFVVRNNGILENIEAHLFGDFSSFGALLVGENNGVIKQSEVYGNIAGGQSIAPVAYKNGAGGSIIESKSSAEMRSNTSFGDKFAGFAVMNHGEIHRSRVYSRIRDDISLTANNVSMVVDTNGPTGKIYDLYVAKESHFEIHGNNAFYFHRLNLGSVIRAYHHGELLKQPTTYATSVSDFPVHNNPGSGIHTMVYRRGGLSGKKLIEREFTACSSPTGNALTISGWNVIPDYVSYHAAYDAAAYYNLPLADKNLIAHVELDNGNSFTEWVWDIDSTNGKFYFNTPLCPDGETGSVTLYVSNDSPVDKTSSLPYPDVILPQESLSAKLGWYGNSALLWDTYANPAHLAAMLNYYAYTLGATSTPVTPAVWEVTDEGLELFHDD